MRVYLRISLLLLTLLCFSTFCFSGSFLFLLLLQLFSGSLLRFSREELLFSGVLLFDFMALHMPERLSANPQAAVLLSWWFSRGVGNWYQIGCLVVI